MDAVQRIVTDRRHGADTLARWAVAALLDAPDRGHAAALASCRPGMPAIANRVAWAWHRYEDGAAPEDILAAIDAEPRRIAGHAPGCTTTVWTVSRSGTVAAVAAAIGRPVRVWRSLPGGEGEAMAEALRQAGVGTRVVADGTCPDGDVLLGADALLGDGTAWNKVGSRALAEAARAAGHKAWVAASTAKAAPDATVEDLAAAAWPARWFEAVPPSAIDGYITEAGLLGTRALARHVASWRCWRQALERP